MRLGEHYSLNLELVHILRLFKSDRGREQHDHLAALIEEERAAPAAANLARQSRFPRRKLALVSGLVESEMFWVKVFKGNVCLVEDGSPLERGG